MMLLMLEVFCDGEEGALRSFPIVFSFSTPLWPCIATSAIHIPLILKPFDWESLTSSSNNGSYNSFIHTN